MLVDISKKLKRNFTTERNDSMPVVNQSKMLIKWNATTSSRKKHFNKDTIRKNTEKYEGCYS